MEISYVFGIQQRPRKAPCLLLPRSPHLNVFWSCIFKTAFFFFWSKSQINKSTFGRGPRWGDVHPTHPAGTNTAAKTTASVFSGGRGEGLWSPCSRARELVPNSFLRTQGPSLSGGSGSALLPHSRSEPGRPPRALTSPEFLGPGTQNLPS